MMTMASRAVVSGRMRFFLLLSLLLLLLLLPLLLLVQEEDEASGGDDDDNSDSANASQSPTTVQERYFTQRLDHFRTDILRDESRTFQQKYFYSDQFVIPKLNSSTISLALLCIGGEHSLDKSILIDSRHCSGDMIDFAKRLVVLQRQEEQQDATESTRLYSIHMFALEHRYYGSSFPTFEAETAASSDNNNNSNNDNNDGDDDTNHNDSPPLQRRITSSPLATENLVYLSSRQAIADIGHFIAAQQQNHDYHFYDNDNDLNWIVFGSSYPGMLAAWSRLELPHLIMAAVSGSAPLQPVVDFGAYKEHVGREFADPLIGGSEECLAIVRDGHSELVSAALDASRHEEIATYFGLCNASSLQDERSLQLFLGDGVFAVDLQYDDPDCQTPLCNTRLICQGLREQVKEHNANALDALVWYVQEQNRTSSSSECEKLDWEAVRQEISDPFDMNQDNGRWRAYTWQQCTEFGFFQTCSLNSTCPFGRGWHPLEQDLFLCKDAFGLEPEQVASGVESTLEYFGGWNLQATRVLSIRATVDPWSRQSLPTSASTTDRPVYQVGGASHHFWTHPPKPTDSQAIKDVRDIIFETLHRWLGELGA